MSYCPCSSFSTPLFFLLLLFVFLFLSLSFLIYYCPSASLLLFSFFRAFLIGSYSISPALLHILFMILLLQLYLLLVIFLCFLLASIVPLVPNSVFLHLHISLTFMLLLVFLFLHVFLLLIYSLPSSSSPSLSSYDQMSHIFCSIGCSLSVAIHWNITALLSSAYDHVSHEIFSASVAIKDGDLSQRLTVCSFLLPSPYLTPSWFDTPSITVQVFSRLSLFLPSSVHPALQQSFPPISAPSLFSKPTSLCILSLFFIKKSHFFARSIDFYTITALIESRHRRRRQSPQSAVDRRSGRRR